MTVFSSINYYVVGVLLFTKKSYEIQPKILTNEENYNKNWTSPKRIYKNK